MQQKRLPDLLLPSHYAIYIHPSLASDHFAGEVHMDATLQQPSQQLTLHAQHIEIHAAHVTIAGHHHALSWQDEPDHELVHFYSNTILPVGPLVLHIAYQGRLGQALHGLYRAKDGDDVTLVTQCEATSARAIFPCLDEPHFKAALQWNITAADNLDIITNGRASRFRHLIERGEQQVIFAATKPISTYLAACTLGELACGSAEKIGHTPSRIWASRGKEGPCQFAQAITRFALPYYENYFGVPYPFDKLDQVAVPGFDAGAMENVGAIFYRQNALLLEPKTASLRACRRVAEIVAHEIAHQWFGNYVTMAWWDDLWLNEAFATWISCKAVHSWQPTYRIWDMQAEAKEEAMQMDSLPSTHPIYTPVHHPQQITELFDAITYEKGCAVLRMVESYMGAEAFRAGLRQYMQDFALGNATAQDLWQKLAQQTSLPIAKVMQSWIHQAGCPLLQVSLDVQPEQTTLTLEQSLFSLGDAQHHPGQGSTWTIPMHIQYWTAKGSAIVPFVLTERTAKLSLPSDEPILFVWPNHDGVAFFRTALHNSLLQHLSSQLCHQLSPGSKISLLHDQWALVQANRLTTVQFAQVLQAFQGETDPLVLQAMGRKLRSLQAISPEIAADPHFAAWIRQLLAPSWEQLGEPEQIQHCTGEAAEAAATTLLLLGELGQEEQLQELASDLVAQEQQDTNTIEPHLASAAIVLQAHFGSLQLFRQFLQTYQHRQQSKQAPELQQRYLQALFSFDEQDSNQHLLALLEQDGLPQEHWRTALCALLGRFASQHQAWAYFTDHYDRLSKQLGDFGLSRVIESLGALPGEQAKTIQQFFAHQALVPERALAKALQTMTYRENLRKRENERFRAYLQATMEGP